MPDTQGRELIRFYLDSCQILTHAFWTNQFFIDIRHRHMIPNIAIPVFGHLMDGP